MKNAKIIGCIQARMGSKRLPKKAMRLIGGKPMVQRIFERLKECKELDGIILATSIKQENDPLVNIADEIGLPSYRGSEEDLILRYLGTLEKFNGEAFVRITGDCPLVDPPLVDKMIQMFKEEDGKIDLVTNISPRSYPKGLDVEILTLTALERLDREVKEPHFREYLTYYIMENPESFTIVNVAYIKDLSRLRWTVDYKEDLKFVNEIFGALGKRGKIFCMQDILSLLDTHPSFADINAKWINL